MNKVGMQGKLGTGGTRLPSKTLLPAVPLTAVHAKRTLVSSDVSFPPTH